MTQSLHNKGQVQGYVVDVCAVATLSCTALGIPVSRFFYKWHGICTKGENKAKIVQFWPSRCLSNNSRTERARTKLNNFEHKYRRIFLSATMTKIASFLSKLSSLHEKKCCLLFSNLSFCSRDLQVFKIYAN